MGTATCARSFIHGARAAMAHFAAKPTPMGAWVRQLLTRAHPNVVAVAVTVKLARIAWAVVRHGRDYEHQAMMA